MEPFASSFLSAILEQLNHRRMAFRLGQTERGQIPIAFGIDIGAVGIQQLCRFGLALVGCPQQRRPFLEFANNSEFYANTGECAIRPGRWHAR